MAFRENFRGVQEQSGEFVKIPEGLYYVVVEKTTESQTQTGLNMIKVKFRITEGEYKNNPLFTNVVFHEKMKGRNMHILKVLGQPYEGEPIIESDNWQGCELRLRVRVRYNERFKRDASEITEWLYLEEPEKEVKEAKEKVEKTFEKEEAPIQEEAPFPGEGEEDEIPF